MLIKKSQIPILAGVLLMLLSFSIYYISTKNYEFIMYVLVILFFFFLILLTNKKVHYSNTSLIGLAFWGFLHMSGGSFRIGGTRLYDFMIIPLTEDIFRYDQFVHIIGFGVATLVMYELIKPKLLPTHKWTAISIVVIMAGLGVGAINEIIEFAATIIMNNTGVGGYTNTLLDLVSDLVGAVIAMTVIYLKERKKENPGLST